MKKATNRKAADTSAKAPTTLPLEHMPMSDVIQALASGHVTATALTKGFAQECRSVVCTGVAASTTPDLGFVW